MALPDETEVVNQGDGCSTRARYRITPEDLTAIDTRLDKIDGDNPYVTYKLDAVQRTLGGGTTSSPGCVAYYLNKKISEDSKLSEFGIFAHTDKGNIRFDRNSPSAIEAEPPAG
jgi:hypothetical protein